MADNYCMSGTLEFFTCYTLIDVTSTGVIKSVAGHSHNKQRNQQRNWETMLQVLSLRTQPMMVSKPVPFNMYVTDMKFGAHYEGVQRVWQFNFAAERAGIYTLDILAADLNQVPCIPGMDSTAELPLAIFSTTSDYKNTYFMEWRT